MSVPYRHGGLRGPTKEPTIGTNWILNVQPVPARNSLRSIFEIVVWFKASIDLSAEQMDAFAELYPHDARPLQPLNGRVVKESQ